MLGKILFGAFALYIALGLGFRSLETRILFHPSQRDITTCPLPKGVQHIRFGAEQGLLTSIGSDRLVVFYHGNGGDMCMWRFIGVNHLARHGVDTLVVEYPGYSGDPRQIGKSALLTTSERAAEWAEGRRYAEISVIGYSMGSAPAAHHAKLGVKRLLLFAPFDSVYNLLWDKGYLYPRAMLRTDFDNAAALSKNPPNTMIIHGGRDSLVPPERGLALAEAIGATFVLRPDRGHSGLFGSPEFDDLLDKWFEM